MSSIKMDNFLQSMECPYGLDLLSDAVAFDVCAHKVNKCVAILLYGPMTAEQVVKNPGPCPVCQKTVRAYKDDHQMRGVVEAFLAMSKKDEIVLASKKAQADLKERSAEYPGKSAKFILADKTEGWRLEKYGNGNTVRVFSLENSPEVINPLINKISFLGFRDGRIRFEIYMNFEDSRKMKPNLAAKGIYTLGFAEVLCADDKDQRNKLFSFVEKHNMIPNEYLSIMRKLSAASDWREVTPLKPGESLD